ncbi:MAG: hypothetical protein HKN64_03765, partial [Woeseiaceae bacterium]|nr:hypothetical protein [Woeseiaceae bacterium]
MTGSDRRSWSVRKVCNPIPKFLALLVASGGVIAMLLLPVSVMAEERASEGVVRFFVDAKSSFDPWTRRPDKKQQAWMRKHYFRMQTYSSYFDKRLAWYPQAWVYKDAYAIKPDWPVFDEHPEWVLRDAEGKLLYLDYGCSNGTCPQYAADIGNPAFRAWWIAAARSKIDLGYAGIWVDDVNLAWRISDGHGKSVRPIDPRTGREMALHDWRRYFANFMGELREALPDIELAHNVIWYAGSTHDPFIRRQIDAADYINLERGISDRGIRGGAGKYGFETFLALIDYVHSRGKNVIMDDDDDDSVAARDYELAFYFLI